MELDVISGSLPLVQNDTTYYDVYFIDDEVRDSQRVPSIAKPCVAKDTIKVRLRVDGRFQVLE